MCDVPRSYVTWILSFSFSETKAPPPQPLRQKALVQTCSLNPHKYSPAGKQVQWHWSDPFPSRIGRPFPFLAGPSMPFPLGTLTGELVIFGRYELGRLEPTISQRTAVIRVIQTFLQQIT